MPVSCATDFTVTEHFFEGLDGVLEARVWTTGKSVLARLVVSEDSNVSGSDLKHACAKALGPEMTPSLLMIERVRPLPLLMAA